MTNTATNIESIGLLGFGTMGRGIAQVLAASGHSVTVLQIDGEGTLDQVAEVNQALSERDSHSETGGTGTPTAGCIHAVTSVTDLAGADMIVDSVTASKHTKVRLLTDVAHIVGESTPLLIATSAIPISELAETIPHPARVAGMHFFHPVPSTTAAEIVPGLHTEPELVDRLVAFVEILGKQPVVVKDRPGFLVDSLLIPYLNDVISELDDELASAADIDVALKLGLGYTTGPLELLDAIGLDVHLRATEAAFEATADVRYAPPPLLRRMVSAGHLGVNSGRGFRTDETSTDQEH
ncbi:3-hydroxyacyl-CoA dehydrogenase family protein [Rhodococcus koreensis]